MVNRERTEGEVWEDLELGQVTLSGAWSPAILVAEEEEEGELTDRK